MIFQNSLIHRVQFIFTTTENVFIKKSAHLSKFHQRRIKKKEKNPRENLKYKICSLYFPQNIFEKKPKQ